MAIGGGIHEWPLVCYSGMAINRGIHEWPLAGAFMNGHWFVIPEWPLTGAQLHPQPRYPARNSYTPGFTPVFPAAKQIRQGYKTAIHEFFKYPLWIHTRLPK